VSQDGKAEATARNKQTVGFNRENR
jgi:hypothetical protein